VFTDVGLMSSPSPAAVSVTASATAAASGNGDVSRTNKEPQLALFADIRTPSTSVDVLVHDDAEQTDEQVSCPTVTVSALRCVYNSMCGMIENRPEMKIETSRIDKKSHLSRNSANSFAK